MTRTVFKGGLIFDGSGSPPSPGDIVVDGRRIVEVGADLDGDVAVELDGKGVIPGLFDCHVHMASNGVDVLRELNKPFSYPYFEAFWNMRNTLDAGITTARDAGGADLGLKEANANGLVPGPRLKIALTILSQTGGHNDQWMACGVNINRRTTPGCPDPIVDGVEAARRKVRELIRAGADQIKVCTSGGVLSPRDDPRHAHFRMDELNEIVAQAQAAHTYVMAHAQATDGIKNAIRAGIRSVEHGVFLDEQAIEMMLEAGTWLVPTLVAPVSVLEAVEAGAGLPPQVVAKARDVIDIHRESIRQAVAAGVKIAMGTDSGVGPHGQNLRELGLMCDAGMTPAAALVATTSAAAELMHLDDDLGMIEPGKRADFVIVRGDLLDVRHLRENIDQVWQDGVLVSDQRRSTT